MSNNDEYLNDLAERFLAVKYMLASENGKILMDLLENECCPTKLIGADPQQTAYKVGKRDVYMYLKEIQNASEESITKRN